MARKPIRMGMRPTHPGVFFRQEVLEPLDLPITAAASILGVRRATLSDLVNEKADLSPEMAARIERAFGAYGVSAKSLLGYQNMLDVYKAEQVVETLDVKRYRRA